MAKFYIAFSIHGTNSFRVVTKEVVGIEPLNLGQHEAEELRRQFQDNDPKMDAKRYDWSLMPSRRSNADVKKDGYKIHWSGLRRKDGTPIQNKSWVSKRFNELKRMGWVEVAPK
jgi:hypothetical protein